MQASVLKYLAVAVALLPALLPSHLALGHFLSASLVLVTVAMLAVRTSSNEAVAALRGSPRQGS